MAREEQVFSPEYPKGTPTRVEEEETVAGEESPIEMQLEREIEDAVKTYGTGKPRRETFRAYLIHD